MRLLCELSHFDSARGVSAPCGALATEKGIRLYLNTAGPGVPPTLADPVEIVSKAATSGLTFENYYERARDRMTHNAGPYKLPTGVVVAENWNDLTDGTLHHAINVTESAGAPSSGRVFVSAITASKRHWSRNGHVEVMRHDSRSHLGSARQTLRNEEPRVPMHFRTITTNRAFARFRVAALGLVLGLTALAAPAQLQAQQKTFAYIAKAQIDSVSNPPTELAVVDTDTGDIVGAVPLSFEPTMLVASPDGAYLYVTHFEAGALSIVDISDPDDRYVAFELPLPAEPGGIEITPDGDLLLIAHQSLNQVSVISTKEPKVPLASDTIAVGQTPGNIAIDSTGTSAYVVNQGDGSVSVIQIDPTAAPNDWSVRAETVGDLPYDVVASPQTGRVFVSNTLSHSVSVLDASGSSIDVLPYPLALEILHSGGMDYLFSGHTGNPSWVQITNVDTGETRSLELPGAPIDAALTPDGSTLVMSHSNGSGYSVLEIVDLQNMLFDVATYPIPAGDGETISYAAMGLAVTQLSDDLDDDGITNGNDNCPRIPNADQLDSDEDGQGDACDLLDGSIGTNIAYVARAGLNDVAVIDLDDQSLLGSIPVGEFPLDVALATTPEGTFGYVPNQGSTTVSVIATSGHAVVDTIDLGAPPFGAAAAPDGKYVYVATQSSGEPGPGLLLVIDTATRAVVASVPVGKSPAFLGVTPDGGQVYVANQESATVSVVDVASLDAHILDPASSIEVHSIQLEAAPFNASFSPDGSLVYIPAQGAEGGLVYVYETASDPLTNEHVLAGSFPVGQFPTGLALSLDGAEAYVASAESSTVSIVDIASVLDPNIPLFIETLGLADGIGEFPVLPELSPGGRFVYLSNHESGDISVISIDTRTVVGSLSLGARVGRTYGLALSPDGQTLYAPASDLSSLEMLDTSSLGSAGTVSLGDGEEPWGVATAPDGTVFVANRDSATVSVVQGESLVATIPVSSFVPQAQSLTGLTVASGRIYVAGGDWTGGMVAVFEASGSYDFVASVPVGQDLYEIVPSPDGQLVYVASRGSDEVSVIRTADNSALASIPVGAAPMGIAISKDGARVYVTHNQTSSMSVIDASLIDIDTGLAPGVDPVLATVPVGSYPAGVEVSPNGTRVYVASTGSDQVEVFDSGVDASGAPLGYDPYPIASFPVGDNPTDLAVSLDGEHVYIASYSGSSISILRTDVNGEPNALVGSIAGTPRPTGIVFLPSLGDDDADDDGIDDTEDNCPEILNADQTDTDADGLGDACDADDDEDGVPDVEDNCALTVNPDQADFELDGLGDRCDSDDDNDGVADEEDNCPTVPNPDQTDANLDGFGDACVSLDALIAVDVTLGERVIIESGASVNKAAAVGPWTIVRAGAVIAKGAFVGERCDIGEGAEISKDVVVGDGVLVGAGAQLQEGVSVGDGAVIGADAFVKAGIQIPAGAIVPEGARIKSQSEADALPIGS